MVKINLDFRYYSPTKEQGKIYEVEAQKFLGSRFKYGYATKEFPDLLIYLISLAKSRQKIPLAEELSFVPRFHNSFPNVEKLVAETVLKLCDNPVLVKDLEEQIEKNILVEHLLLGKQTVEQRDKQFLSM